MPKSESPIQIEEFLSSVANAPRRVLMLDYDGTLAPFRKERDQAVPYPQVATKLQEFVRDGHTRVVIISGREIGEVVSLLDIHPMPELWGVYGLQRRKPNGEIEVAPIEPNYLRALSDARRWIEYQQLLPAAEFKTGSIAVHWRGRTPAEIEEIRGRVLLGWKAIANSVGLSILEFDGGLEIRVPGKDKGDVVRGLLKEMGPDVRAAYLGDDLTDEPAFRAIRGTGLGVLVRPQWRETAAKLWIKPPDAVVEFLLRWHDACQRQVIRNGAKAGVANG